MESPLDELMTCKISDLMRYGEDDRSMLKLHFKSTSLLDWKPVLEQLFQHTSLLSLVCILHYLISIAITFLCTVNSRSRLTKQLQKKPPDQHWKASTSLSSKKYIIAHTSILWYAYKVNIFKRINVSWNFQVRCSFFDSLRRFLEN